MNTVQLIANRTETFWRVDILRDQEKSGETVVHFVCDDSEFVFRKTREFFENVFKEHQGISFGGLDEVSVLFENACRMFARERMYETLDEFLLVIKELEAMPNTRGQKAAIRGLRDEIMRIEVDVATSFTKTQTTPESSLFQ